MNESSLETLPPETLARLLDLEAPSIWNSADAAAALEHQLAAPLLPDVAQSPGAEPARIAASAAKFPTLQAALLASDTPLELLQAIKHWSRHLRGAAESPLAGAPATVLYFAAIAAAWVQRQEKISTLPADELRDGFTWAAEQPGVSALKPLLEKARTTLPKIH